MTAPYAFNTTSKHKSADPHPAEYVLTGSLLSRPELFKSVAYLNAGDFMDVRLGAAFEAMRLLDESQHAINHLTASACAAGRMPEHTRDNYERELGEYLALIQHDYGYRRNLDAEAQLLRKARLDRERKEAAALGDWEAVQRATSAIIDLNAPRVRVMTAAELWGKQFAPLRWLVNGVLPEGVTVLVSPPKVGKTRLALQLAVAVASGGYALNNAETECQQADVLYLGLESGDRRMQKDLMQLTDAPPASLQIASTWRRLSEGGTSDLERWLDRNPSTRLVILDTLAKVRDRGHGGKGFLYSADYDTGAAIKSVADAREVSIVLVHHTNKMTDCADPLDAVSGSTGVTGSVDHILMLKRNRLETDGLLTLISRDYEDRQWAMRFERGLWTLVGNPEQAAVDDAWRGDGESDARNEILFLLRQQGAMEPKEILARTGNKNARKLLMKLSEAGKVVRRMDGKYVAESGNSGNTGNTGNTGNSGNSHIKSTGVAGCLSGNSSGNSENSNQGVDKNKELSIPAVAVATVATVATFTGDPSVENHANCGNSANSANSGERKPAVVATADVLPSGATSDARELWGILKHVRGIEVAARLAAKLGWNESRVIAAAMELRRYGRASVNGSHVGLLSDDRETF